MSTNFIEMSVFARAFGHGHISYSLSDSKRMNDHYDKDPAYKYLCSVNVPEISEKDVKELLLQDIEKDIAESQMKINGLIDKKNQLLAISHEG